MNIAPRTLARVTALFATGLILAPGFAAAAGESEATWDTVRPTVFGERTIEEGVAVMHLVAPKRAEDAALVPVQIRIHAPGEARVKAVTLVVDENPAPVAATVKFGEAARTFDLSTRLRVNSFSFIRAIAETTDGKLHMAKAYVRAAGGCSAPAGKDPQEAKAQAGEIRFRSFADTGRDEAQVQIRHPNNSGLQMDRATGGYIPAWFIDELRVTQGERMLFSAEGGISISEDPTYRFSFHPTAEPVTVEAKDTEGRVFRQTFAGGEGT